MLKRRDPTPMCLGSSRLEMSVDIHPLVQNADHFNFTVGQFAKNTKMIARSYPPDIVKSAHKR